MGDEDNEREDPHQNAETNRSSPSRIQLSPKNSAGDEENGRKPQRNSEKSSATSGMPPSLKNSADCVRVAVRIRPLLETDDSCIHHQRNSIRIGTSLSFQFDQVFGPGTHQEAIFNNTVAPLVEQCLLGYNATVLAYGQTGSGKTHTIMGSNIGLDSSDTGVIPRALNSLFQQLEGQDTQVSIQFLELYGEEIRDLLTVSKSKLIIREIDNEPEVVGATTVDVQSVEGSLKCLQAGLLRRVTGATAMNSSSSRSHAILTVRIQQSHTKSKLHFVDLAGAERHKRTAATGKRLQEGIDINRGLSNLGNVIQALTEARSHVPYRDAKLTRLLQGSLGGNHKTVMIACVSPAMSNMAESVNCLRYANRAKKIENSAKVNDVENGSEKARIRELEAQLSEVAADCVRVIDGQPAVYYTIDRLKELVAENGRVTRKMPPTPSSFTALSPTSVGLFEDHSAGSDGADSHTGCPTLCFSPAGHDSILDASILEKEEQLIEEQKGLLTSIQSVIQDEGEHFDITSSSSPEGEHLENEFGGRELLSTPQQAKLNRVATALEELSQSIEVKERLIEQIKQNKEREDTMRKFYEEKLEELHGALQEKETERDQMIRDLEDAKEHVGDELRGRLEEKERQIASLKKIQSKYRKQTVEASRSASDLSKLTQLQDDVKKMKKKKADMQKELAQEKRAHQKELNRINKVVVQKDRQINKIQKESTQHLIKAQKATAISKTRLEELAQLKKTLRRYKKEIGLDPVLVGKRQSGRKQEKKRGIEPIDADIVRNFFDKKVAEVVRKEALVDKLANEWEEYFELFTELNELGDADSDSRDTLRLQIQCVNEKIRKTAKVLGKEHPKDHAKQNNKDRAADEKPEVFLFDRDFAKLCNEKEISGPTMDAAAKVLFGMVVRERRRVAALAKTASSLDERVQIAEKTATTSEAALRSYVNEHSEEMMKMEQKHQDHIISLMDMVNHKVLDEAGSRGNDEEGDDINAEQKLQSQLLVLANERVLALESQLSVFRKEETVGEEYSKKLAETESKLSTFSKECEWLERSRNDLRAVIRQIRQETDKWQDSNEDESGLFSRIFSLTDEVLHPSGKGSRWRKSPHKAPDHPDRLRIHLSPRLERHIELMHSSDSDCTELDDEDDDPAWAASIMEDLCLIAEGKVPPSLSVEDSVFDRLANPRSYTGTQKQRAQTPLLLVETSPPRNKRPQIKNMDNADETESEYEADAPPAPYDEALPMHDRSVELDDHSPTDHQSVFDRLFSPSYFTGTQKKRIQESKARRDRSAEDAANRVLGGLLDTEAEQVDKDIPKKLPHTEPHSRRTVSRVAPDKVNRATTKGNNGTKTLASNGRKKRQTPPQTSTEENDGSLSSASTKREYTKQNVFDRLQKTTTRSTAVRQAASRHNEISSTGQRPTVENRPNEAVTGKSPEPIHGQQVAGKGKDDKHERQTQEYMRQNVFERLTKTSTEAFSQKVHQ